MSPRKFENFLKLNFTSRRWVGLGWPENGQEIEQSTFAKCYNDIALNGIKIEKGDTPLSQLYLKWQHE